MSSCFLAGDFGGTNARLALFREAEESLSASSFPLTLVRDHVYPSRSVSDPGETIREFLGSELRDVRAGCLGIAGPVLEGVVETTNLPWTLSERELSSRLGFALRLQNDLAANVYGLATLPASSFHVLQQGAPRSEVCVIASAGTGLGEGIFLKSEKGWQVLPSEGGHSDFAPRDEVEVHVWRSLQQRFGRVSVERVVSGPGLKSLYDALAELDSYGPVTPDVDRRVQEADDPSAEISKAAATNECGFCCRVVERWVELYGAEAGNLALKALALGGVYLGGGIAPKLLSFFDAGHFLRGFNDKGRMGEILQTLPVSVVLEESTALRGAAAFARFIR